MTDFNDDLQADVPVPEFHQEFARVGRPRKYPWDEWLNPSRITILRRGVHFDCSVESIIRNIKYQMKDMGFLAGVHLSIRRHRRDETVVMVGNPELFLQKDTSNVVEPPPIQLP